MAKTMELQGREDVSDRLETNLLAFIRHVLDAKQIKAQYLSSTDTEPMRDNGVVVRVDAASSMQTIDMGAAYRSELIIEIIGQVDKVSAKSHRVIVAAVYGAMFDIRPDVRLRHASRQLLDAMNRTPGRRDLRPCAAVHLIDIMNPSRNLQGRDSSASTILTGTTTFQAGDWPSDVPPNWHD